MLVGDGVSDLAARSVVDLVIGFGGVATRQRLMTEADVFIKSNSLAPVLVFGLSQTEKEKLENTPNQDILNKGLSLIEAGEVLFNV